MLLLEKTSFPREKVCGDGLTPRGTRALIDMGIDVSEKAGWLHNRGLRVIGGGPHFVRLGRAVLYRLEDLETWIASNRRRTTSEQLPPH